MSVYAQGAMFIYGCGAAESYVRFFIMDENGRVVKQRKRGPIESNQYLFTLGYLWGTDAIVTNDDEIVLTLEPGLTEALSGSTYTIGVEVYNWAYSFGPAGVGSTRTTFTIKEVEVLFQSNNP